MNQSDNAADGQQEVAADDVDLVAWQKISDVRLAELDQLVHYFQVRSLFQDFNVNSKNAAKEFLESHIAVFTSSTSSKAHRRKALDAVKSFFARIDQAKQSAEIQNSNSLRSLCNKSTSSTIASTNSTVPPTDRLEQEDEMTTDGPTGNVQAVSLDPSGSYGRADSSASSIPCSNNHFLLEEQKPQQQQQQRHIQPQSNHTPIVANNQKSLRNFEDTTEPSERSPSDKDRRFDPDQAGQWADKCKELGEYRDKFGHCLVPITYHENLALARWVGRQRKQYKLMMEGKHSTMTQKHIKELEDIGFVWDQRGSTWIERLGELQGFRNTHMHCNVPQRFSKNKRLASWVKRQRDQYKLYVEGKRSNLTPQRIQDLENLGFEWKSKRGTRNECRAGSKESLNLLSPALPPDRTGQEGERRAAAGPTKKMPGGSLGQGKSSPGSCAIHNFKSLCPMSSKGTPSAIDSKQGNLSKASPSDRAGQSIETTTNGHAGNVHAGSLEQGKSAAGESSSNMRSQGGCEGGGDDEVTSHNKGIKQLSNARGRFLRAADESGNLWEEVAVEHVQAVARGHEIQQQSPQQMLQPAQPAQPAQPPMQMIHRSDIGVKDVLGVKGQAKKPANQFYNQLLNFSHFKGHDRLSSHHTAISSVHQAGGRFLTPIDTSGEQWQEVSVNEALKNIRKKKRMEPKVATAKNVIGQTGPENRNQSRKTRLTEQAPVAPALLRCTERDVLMGHVEFAFSWPANERFSQVLIQHTEKYAHWHLEHSMVSRKEFIAFGAILETIQGPNGGARFLQHQQRKTGPEALLEEAWFQVDLNRVVQAVSQLVPEADSQQLYRNSNIAPGHPSGSGLAATNGDHVARAFTLDKDHQPNDSGDEGPRLSCFISPEIIDLT